MMHFSEVNFDYGITHNRNHTNCESLNIVNLDIWIMNLWLLVLSILNKDNSKMNSKEILSILVNNYWVYNIKQLECTKQ